jgi:hypothetical protein
MALSPALRARLAATVAAFLDRGIEISDANVFSSRLDRVRWCRACIAELRWIGRVPDHEVPELVSDAEPTRARISELMSRCLRSDF